MADTGCEARLLPLGKSDIETLIRRNEAPIKQLSEAKLTVQKHAKILVNLCWYVIID